MAEILLDSNAFRHNLKLITQTIKQKPALVLKDNAYGHGLHEIANMAQEYGIKDVFVKNYAEAKEVACLFESISILYGGLDSLDTLGTNMALVINNKDILDSLRHGDKVELKINVGMNRNGIDLSECQEFCKEIAKRGLVLFGVLAHIGFGDEGGDDFTRQLANFKQAKQHITTICNKLGIKLPRFHCLSSSGALRLAQNQECIEGDLVRVGIAAYGYLEAPLDIAKDLKKVASLWAHRICSQTIKKGQSIGYGGKSIVDKDCIVSTYDIGYGDGFFRVSENHMLTTAEGYKILPRTSMDCFSCMSDKPKVCLMSDAKAIAKVFGTISYEVLVRLSPFIKRIVIPPKV
ncbi:alanine racemase [Helicobacter sp. 10-6591]|uniref:alanine racemase n=1 Tax=Helicobacter sp. 10-6591 TaxID=2004998 RepID=UPI000DCCBD3E|nr:alanine racemase [Helicobacter sp. 10-6591]RAX56348.1 alanine racemase [Helicobacter sp. 10-6591]